MFKIKTPQFKFYYLGILFNNALTKEQSEKIEKYLDVYT